MQRIYIYKYVYIYMFHYIEVIFWFCLTVAKWSPVVTWKVNIIYLKNKIHKYIYIYIYLRKCKCIKVKK